MKKLRSWLREQSLYTIIGIFFTLSYLGIILDFFGSRLAELQYLPLNEVGDFLAGVFGPIAFLWLVIGYLMQNRELKNQISEYSQSVEVSQNTLELYKAQETHRAINEFNRSQPIFFIGQIRNPETHFSNSFEFILSNKGALILDLQFSYFDKAAEKYIPCKRLKVLDIHKLKKVEFKSPWGKLPIASPANMDQELQFGKMKIEYSDSNHLKQTAHTEILAVSDGQKWEFKAVIQQVKKELTPYDN